MTQEQAALAVNRHISIPMSEISLSAVRSSGPGGQNVNAVATAVQLRFDVPGSSLPEPVKARLLHSRDKRLTKDGVLVIKAQTARTREANRRDALDRLRQAVRAAAWPVKKRRQTQPSRSARERRLLQKKRRSRIKSRRGWLAEDDSD